MIVEHAFMSGHASAFMNWYQIVLLIVTFIFSEVHTNNENTVINVR